MKVSELLSLCTALLHNMFYQCMKFQAESFSTLEDVAQTKLQREIIKGQ